MSYPHLAVAAPYDCWVYEAPEAVGDPGLRLRLQTCGQLLSANIGDTDAVSQLLLLDERGVRDLIYALQQWLALKEGMG